MSRIQKETDRHFKRIMHSPTEVIGSVEEVHEDEVILSFTRQRYVIPLRSDELLKWRNHLKVGSQVAILILNNGSIRVRNTE